MLRQESGHQNDEGSENPRRQFEGVDTQPHIEDEAPQMPEGDTWQERFLKIEVRGASGGSGARIFMTELVGRVPNDVLVFIIESGFFDEDKEGGMEEYREALKNWMGQSASRREKLMLANGFATFMKGRDGGEERLAA